MVTPESGAAPGTRHIAIRRKRTIALIVAYLMPTNAVDNRILTKVYPH
jgi:hypothetical protein